MRIQYQNDGAVLILLNKVMEKSLGSLKHYNNAASPAGLPALPFGS
jgi:hypothetical protein